MHKSLKYIFRISSLVLLLLMMSACNGDDEASESVDTGPPAGAWIDAPLSGGEAPPGYDIDDVGHVAPEVGQAVLYINGANSGLPAAPIPGKQPPAYQWKWSTDQPGIYFLRVGGASGPLSSPVMVTITGDMTFRAEFTADLYEMKLGECTAMHWKTENAVLVQLDGKEVDKNGDLGVCIQGDEVHILHVEYKDEHTEDLSLKLTQLIDTPTPTPTATATKYIPPPPVETEPPPAPDTQPPPAPSGLSPCGSSKSPAEVRSCTNVALSWSPVKDKSGIKQYQISVMNTYTSQVQKYYSTGPSYTIPSVDGKYMWTVSAQDNAGNWGPTSNACYFICVIVK